MKRKRSFRWPVLAALLGAACATGDSTGPPNGGGGNPTITITVSPGSLTLAQGANGTVTATIGRGGGFTGQVTITVEGAPTGMTASPSPGTIAAGSTTSTISIAVGATVTAGNHTLTIRASGSGVTAVTGTVTITVTAVQLGSFTLAMSPAALTIQQGAQANSTVNIARSGGFTGAVSLTVTGAPAGVTATLNPTSATGATSTLTVVVAGTVVVGNYSLTIRGTATGLTEQTATLAVQVTSSGGGGGNVTWDFCAATGIPVWFAFQDGTGAWTRVTGTNNRYTFNIGSARGGVAIAYAPTGATDLDIFYGTQAELTAQGPSGCATGGGVTKTVNGTVANVGATEQAWITLGGAFATVLPGMGTNFTLREVVDGPTDLLAARIAIDVNTGTFMWNKGIIRRAQNPAANSTMPVLDFNAAEAFTPVTRNVAINNLAGETAFLTTQYFTAAGWTGTFFTAIGGAGANQQYTGVPAANQVTGDLHLLLVGATPPGQNPATNRVIMTMFKDAADKTVTLGPVIGAVTVSTASTTGFARMRAVYTVQAEMNRYWSFSGSQTVAATGRSFSIGVSSGYLGTAATFDFTIPDFTTVAGWNNAWGPATGSTLTWSFSANGWSAPGGNLTTPFVEGGTFTTASRTGTITP